MFIFRNYTIENLFDDATFSGYGDISEIPESDSYVWFYNVPLSPDAETALAEVEGIARKLEIVAERIPASAPFFIFSLENLFKHNICDTDFRLKNAIDDANRIAIGIAAKHSNARYVDFGEFFGAFSPEELISWRFYFISQMVMNPVIAPKFKEWWNGRRRTLEGVRKKCLVLDLDNTLWSGVLGEDGIGGIKMSGDYPGNAFQYFQEGLVELAKSGVILTICSKNNESDVRELWEKNPFLKLRPEHIAAYRINWNNKADNIRGLAAELNIGLDSMVFADDNPTERELVRRELPMVSVPEFPKKPYGLMEFYAVLVNEYFRSYTLTDEDRNKTGQYRDNARRAAEQSNFADLDSFIDSLNIEIDIIPADEFNIPRIAQMSQKTNQFNLTTRRYTEADIHAFVASGADVMCIAVRDRFGDNGITGEMIITRNGDTADIDTMLLSCRILGKRIETVFLQSVLDRLGKDGVKRVTASYIPTKKNSQVADFYDRHGFTVISEDEGSKRYVRTLDAPIEISNSYRVTFK